LFVAIDPPLAVCEELAAWARSALRALGLRTGAARAPVRLLDPELMHVTLCFLGERPMGEIDVIEQALAASAASVGELQVGAPVWLPPRRPRSLAVEIHAGDDHRAGAIAGAGDAADDPGDGLQALHEALIGALARACGIEPERRRFRAHVTLARLRGGGGDNRIERVPLPATPALGFIPETIVLYRSWLSPSGASYEALRTCTLTPP
jgi:2'-5' RNA ligase